MGFLEAVSTAFKNYVNFSGRATRPEYWWFTLFLFLVSLLTAGIDMGVLGYQEIGPVNAIFALATLLPALAVSVRRLHDIDKSGWWLLIAFIPLVGLILLIYWACQPGTPTANTYDSPQRA
ncbi:MAG: DUF805 domain-containing protein [Hyphomicrobiaceae bacterium]